MRVALERHAEREATDPEPHPDLEPDPHPDPDPDPTPAPTPTPYPYPVALLRQTIFGEQGVSHPGIARPHASRPSLLGRRAPKQPSQPPQQPLQPLQPLQPQQPLPRPQEGAALPPLLPSGATAPPHARDQVRLRARALCISWRP